ncbi:hypothetical protein [Neorhodopirellula lusitana]|uniref:hypothetical protein n=1 Tax=Neorhodopirellula lusitana TaxID=445327 RepID=UPI00384BF13A
MSIAEDELKQLILEEAALSAQANRKPLFFPESEGSPPLQSRGAVRTGSVGSFFGTDRFTDHNIAGYLQHIPKNRDEEQLAPHHVLRIDARVHF